MSHTGGRVDKNFWGKLGTWTYLFVGLIEIYSRVLDDEEEKTDGEEEEVTEAAPADNLQTASGLATPSGMAPVVSTVAAGLETPEFPELRKTTRVPVRDESGNRRLHSVLPEKQMSVGGLMSVSDVSGARCSKKVTGSPLTYAR